MLGDGTKSSDYDPQAYKRKAKSGVVKDLPSPAATAMETGKRSSDGSSAKNPAGTEGSRKASQAKRQTSQMTPK